MRLSTATETVSEERASVRVCQDALEVGMDVQDDVRTATGLRLLSAGQTLTPALKQRLGNGLRLDAVFGTVRVLNSTADATNLSA